MSAAFHHQTLKHFKDFCIQQQMGKSLNKLLYTWGYAVKGGKKKKNQTWGSVPS